MLTYITYAFLMKYWRYYKYPTKRPFTTNSLALYCPELMLIGVYNDTSSNFTDTQTKGFAFCLQRSIMSMLDLQHSVDLFQAYLLLAVENFYARIYILFVSSSSVLLLSGWKSYVFGVILVHIFPHSNWIRRNNPYLLIYSFI